MTLAEFVAQWEGLRLTAYPDPGTGGEPFTIGYGCTVYPSGTKVQKGDVCTKADALRYLQHDLQAAEAAVSRLVTVPLTEEQRIALVSFTYNCGAGALAKSTLLRLTNNHRLLEAADEFPKWNRAGGKVLPGLTRRRAAERTLYLAGVQQPSQDVQGVSQSSLEPPMLPFVAAAIPALLEAAPALVRLFGSGSEVSERNAKAAEAVAEVAKAVTQADTIEGAVKAIQNDPAKAAEFREAVHLNMTEWLGVLKDAAASDDASADRSVERALRLSAASGGKWLYLLGGIALVVVAASYAVTAGVLFGANSFSDETKALLLGQVVIFGFGTVLAWLFGSNVSNRIRDQRDGQG